MFGAELSGVDLTSDLDKSVLDEIEKLLLEHEVIFLEIKIFLGNNIKKLLNTLDHSNLIQLIVLLMAILK